MTASTYDVEESLTRRSPIAQLATTVFVGVPMTLALVIGLAFYCIYECLKFALAPKPPRQIAPSDEQNFTKALTNFASIHTPGPSVSEAKPVETLVATHPTPVHAPKK